MNMDDASVNEIEEALIHMGATAKRCFPVVGNGNYVTPWDKAHQQLNDLLDARDRAMQAVTV